MTDRDLMQQALEALSDYIPMYDKRMSTITALRERLAQPEHYGTLFANVETLKG